MPVRCHGRSSYQLAVGSVPAAFIGGGIDLPGEVYRPLVASVLLAGAWRLWSARITEAGEADRPGVPWLPGIAAGAGIGLLAGLSGTGGGIFLTPLLVLAGWTRTRDAAGLSGAFILVNSVSGLGGLILGGFGLPDALPLWVAAVAAGGMLGSWLGAARLSIMQLRRVLAFVLVIAAIKLVVFP